MWLFFIKTRRGTPKLTLQRAESVFICVFSGFFWFFPVFSVFRFSVAFLKNIEVKICVQTKRFKHLINLGSTLGCAQRDHRPHWVLNFCLMNLMKWKFQKFSRAHEGFVEGFPFNYMHGTSEFINQSTEFSEFSRVFKARLILSCVVFCWQTVCLLQHYEV